MKKAKNPGEVIQSLTTTKKRLLEVSHPLFQTELQRNGNKTAWYWQK